MDVRRILRVSEAVKEELYEIIGFELEDPRLLEVEVTDVQVSPIPGTPPSKWRCAAISAGATTPSRPSNTLRGTCGRNWLRDYSSGMFPSCILNRTRIRTSRAGLIFCFAGQENLGGATKISPKTKQNVLVLFLLALPAAYGQQEL